MALFLIGTVLFFGTHFYSAFRSREPGNDIKKRIGEKRYMGAYSLVSLMGFALLVFGYGQTEPTSYLYAPHYDLKWLSLCLMLLAFILLTATYVPCGKIKSLVKHPMLLSVILWALAHLLLISHQTALWLFGGFLLFAIIDILAVSKRESAVADESTLAWNRYDLVALLIGSTAYLWFLCWGHQAIFGRSILG